MTCENMPTDEVKCTGKALLPGKNRSAVVGVGAVDERILVEH